MDDESIADAHANQRAGNAAVVRPGVHTRAGRDIALDIFDSRLISPMCGSALRSTASEGAIPASNAAAGALARARIDAMASVEISNARHAPLRRIVRI